MTNKKNKSFRHRVRPLSQLSVGLSISRKKYIRSTREKLLDVLEGKIEFHSILPLSRRESSWLQREECSHRCLAGQLEAEINQRQIEIDRKWPKKKQQLFFEALVPLKRARKKWNRERKRKKKSSHKKKSAERRRRKVKLIYHLVSTHLSLSFSLCSEVWLPPHTESRPEKKISLFLCYFTAESYCSAHESCAHSIRYDILRFYFHFEFSFPDEPLADMLYEIYFKVHRKKERYISLGPANGKLMFLFWSVLVHISRRDRSSLSNLSPVSDLDSEVGF